VNHGGTLDHWLQLNEHLEGDGPTIFAHACKMGLEGIVVEAQGLDASLQPLAGLAQNEEPGGAGGEAREAEEDWSR